ncbi:MAG: ABC transporter ATP-binding protein [Bifidobacteriales bacterium]|nr:ABC transporter ATP-binding protein [Bifidobacteriales bacterium]
MAYIEFNSVVKSYPSGRSVIKALDQASFTADQGKLTIILGASGAGKTTALNILGGMDTAISGQVSVGDRQITSLDHHELIDYRRNDIGFVFQFYNLVPSLTALENVELASQICADHFDPARTLEDVGLKDRMDNFPSQLSGGEQQRVAIARVIAKRPKILLCDEPTGALDFTTGREVLGLLQTICRQHSMTVLIITHNSALAPMADNLIRFHSGKVISQEVNDHPTPVEEIEW